MKITVNIDTEKRTTEIIGDAGVEASFHFRGTPFELITKYLPRAIWKVYADSCWKVLMDKKEKEQK